MRRFITLSAARSQNCDISVRSRRHHPPPLPSGPPPERSHWPGRPSVRRWAGPEPAGGCSARVEEGQLLSAAEEGTEESVQCVRLGQWLVPGSVARSLAAATGLWRERNRGKYLPSCRELLAAADSVATAWKFFRGFSPVGGPDAGGGSVPGAVSRSAQPHAKPNGPRRPRQLQCHLLLQLHRFPATGNGDM